MKFSIIELELLAIVWAIENFKITYTECNLKQYLTKKQKCQFLNQIEYIKRFPAG